MKKIIISIGILLFLFLFFPIRIVYKDGGTIVYKALTYSITNHHKIIFDSEAAYQTGLTIKVLNHTIYEKINDPLEKEIKNGKETEKKEQMLRIHDKLYYNTNEIITIGRCGVGIEEITSFVPETEVPMQNEQVNFTGEIKYQEITEDQIDVWMNDAWYRFETRK